MDAAGKLPQPSALPSRLSEEGKSLTFDSQAGYMIISLKDERIMVLKASAFLRM